MCCDPSGYLKEERSTIYNNLSNEYKQKNLPVLEKLDDDYNSLVAMFYR